MPSSFQTWPAYRYTLTVQYAKSHVTSAWELHSLARNTYIGSVVAPVPFTPEPFAQASDALRRFCSSGATPHISLEEIPAPGRLAPWAFALNGDVDASAVPHTPSCEDEVATGRVVLLYDPSEPEAWNGQFRMVTYIRAELEHELGQEALLGPVAWSWLTDALETYDCDVSEVGGTTTRALSESFGTLAARPATIDLEMRASWTPVVKQPKELEAHVHAWAHLLSTVAGVPPLPEGVSAFPGRLR